MSKIICICPTHRDHRELSALKNGHVFLHHDYASVGLEDLTAHECPSEVFIGHPEQEINAILKRCREEQVQGVITTDVYPVTTLLIVGPYEFKLPGPTPWANWLFQLKFY